jgi:hypothetical protein
LWGYDFRPIENFQPFFTIFSALRTPIPCILGEPEVVPQLTDIQFKLLVLCTSFWIVSTTMCSSSQTFSFIVSNMLLILCSIFFTKDFFPSLEVQVDLFVSSMSLFNVQMPFLYRVAHTEYIYNSWFNIHAHQLYLCTISEFVPTDQLFFSSWFSFFSFFFFFFFLFAVPVPTPQATLPALFCDGLF